MLLADLGVTKTHSRPHVSNDNPYSESQFKTLKYRPAFPERFGSVQHVRELCRGFFCWYNTEHRHSGIGLMTPEAVHHGRAEQLHEDRRKVLSVFFDAPPERFVKGRPKTSGFAGRSLDQPAAKQRDARDWLRSDVGVIGRPGGTPGLRHLQGSFRTPSRLLRDRRPARAVQN